MVLNNSIKVNNNNNNNNNNKNNNNSLLKTYYAHLLLLFWFAATESEDIITCGARSCCVELYTVARVSSNIFVTISKSSVNRAIVPMMKTTYTKNLVIQDTDN